MLLRLPFLLSPIFFFCCSDFKVLRLKNSRRRLLQAIVVQLERAVRILKPMKLKKLQLHLPVS